MCSRGLLCAESFSFWELLCLEFPLQVRLVTEVGAGGKQETEAGLWARLLSPAGHGAFPLAPREVAVPAPEHHDTSTGKHTKALLSDVMQISSML